MPILIGFLLEAHRVASSLSSNVIIMFNFLVVSLEELEFQRLEVTEANLTLKYAQPSCSLLSKTCLQYLMLGCFI